MSGSTDMRNVGGIKTKATQSYRGTSRVNGFYFLISCKPVDPQLINTPPNKKTAKTIR